jgi:hypothetical protein
MIGLSAATRDPLRARVLGARGSRTPVGHDDPAGDPEERARRPRWRASLVGSARALSGFRAAGFPWRRPLTALSRTDV